MAQLAFHVDRWGGGSFNTQHFAKWAALADEGGYKLAALHLLAAAAQLKLLDAKGTEHLAQLKAELATEPLWRPFVRVEPWVKALAELRQLAAPPVPAAAPEDAMVCWLVELFELGHNCYEIADLTPKLRRRLANGGWSKGRSIPLAKLSEGEYDQCLAPEDLTLKAGVVDCGGFSPCCEFKPETLARLVGHPHLFMERKGVERPVRIVAGECYLRAEKCPGGHRLSPPFPGLDLSELEQVLVKESDDLYRLHPISPDLRRMSAP